MLAQAALPYALLGGKKAVNLLLRGGTNTKHAPPIDFYVMALFPLLLKAFGLPKHSLRVKVQKRGFYPKGGGEVSIFVNPVASLPGLWLVQRGNKVVKIDGIVYADGIGRKVVKDVQSLIRKRLSKAFPGIPLNILKATEHDEQKEAQQKLTPGAVMQAKERHRKQYKHKPKRGQIAASLGHTSNNIAQPHKNGLTLKDRRRIAEERTAKVSGNCGCLLVIKSDSGAIITGDSLVISSNKSGSGQVSASEVAENAVKQLQEAWEAEGAVDEHLADQLVIYMTLASSFSVLLCPKRTSISSEHLATAIFISSLLTSARFYTHAVGCSSPEDPLTKLRQEITRDGFDESNLKGTGWKRVGNTIPVVLPGSPDEETTIPIPFYLLCIPSRRGI